MYISPGQGQTTPWGQMLMSTESPYHFAHLLQVLKQSLGSMILNTFLMIFYMYIALGQGQTTPWGQTFDVNRKPLSLRPFLASFKQISLNSDFIHIFMPRHQKVAGYYVIPSEILSVRPSVRPSVHQRPPPFLYRQLLLQF